MKIVKASNGKTRVTLSKKEWKEIGKTAGWLPSEDQSQLMNQFDQWVYSTFGPSGTKISAEQESQIKNKANEMGIEDYLDVAPTSLPDGTFVIE